MKAKIILVGIISVVLTSIQVHAENSYTCSAYSATTKDTVYLDMNLGRISNVPRYESSSFNHATPIQAGLKHKNASVYYWTQRSSPTDFNVIAILETDDVINETFKGRLSITSSSGKPYGSIFELDCHR